MSKKLGLLFASLLCFSLLFFGCKSKPEAPADESPVEEVVPVEEEKVEEPVAAEVVTEEPSMTEEEMNALAQQAIKDAMNNKKRIESLEFIDYDQASYDAGEKALADYKALYDAGGSAKELLELAQNARNSYQTVLDKGFSTLASQKKAEVMEIRQSSINIKADRASKKEFSAAELLYISAEDSFTGKNFEQSYEFYCKAFDSFTVLYQNVVEKKAKADEAIERAKNKTEEINEFAQQADEIAPLPEDAVEEESSEVDSETVAEPENIDSVQSELPQEAE